MADEQFYTILTNIGKAKVANAALLSSNVTLKTLKVGDGNGAYYNPTEDQKDLKNTVYTCNVGSVSVDKDNPNWIVAETIIPGSVGGFTIREVGLFDVDGDMIAIGKYPETYKPVVANGASKDLNVRTIFEVSNAASVNLSINPSVIIATKEDINNLQIQIDENHSSLKEMANDINNYGEFTTANLISQASEVESDVMLDTINNDNSSLYSLNNSTGEVTILKSGTYLVQIYVSFSGNSNGDRFIRCTHGANNFAETLSAPLDTFRVNFCKSIYINANEKIKLSTRQNSGVSLNRSTLLKLIKLA